MLRFIVSYYVLDALLIIGAIIFTWWARKKRLRSKSQEPPKGYAKTNEVFVDPTTSVKQQVWFNPETGERYYQTLKK